jgi:hypothetical protein
MYAKSLSAISFTQGLMNPHNGTNDNSKKDRITAIATAVPMAGILVAAALLSALSLNNFEPAIAQAQNMTAGSGGNATSAAGGNATSAAGGNATSAAGGNATSAAGGNQTNSEVIMHLQEVRTAIEDDDDDTALMHLDLALNALGGGNMTSTTGGGNATTADGGTTAEDGEEGEDGGE